MAITIELPQVGESVVEGIIGKWLKKPGDVLEKYEPLVEVITDKVTMEVPSPVNGVLTRILVDEGATVPMGTPIAEVETDDAPATIAPGGVPQEVDTTGYLVRNLSPVGPTGGGVEQADMPPTAPTTRVTEPQEQRDRHSPAVRRLAREHNVDLSLVKGTGIGGRVSRKDLLEYVETQASKTPPASELSEGAMPAPDEEGILDEIVNLTPVRRIIAKNMSNSVSEIPHAWSMVEADVSTLVRFREGLREEFQRQEGVDLTYLPFVIKAVAESLREHPLLNSTWGGDKIYLKKRIHLGIAVGAPDGLVVPVIHDADARSIAELARSARDLTSKAREGKLALQDVQGGTFTVNNTGALGSIISQPIINYPQAAILTTEAIQKRPVVVDDAVEIRSMMNLCLSFDHRINDGLQAGAFLQSMKRRLEAMGPDTSVY